MAIGKSGVDINLKKLSIKFGDFKIIEKGKLAENYIESNVENYMKNEKIDLTINLEMGSKFFIAYTMDLTKKYIEINSDYRSWLVIELILKIMIKYNLICKDCTISFDSWFSSSKEFEKLKKKIFLIVIFVTHWISKKI